MTLRRVALPILGFELRGLSVRLTYDDCGLALDRQPSAHSHADVAPLLARLFDDARTGLVAGLVNDARRLCAAVRIDDGGSPCNVAPTAIYRTAIVCGAQAVYIAHRHAEGAAEPSAEDLASAARVHALGYVLGLELRDSLIFGADGSYASLREHGQGAEDWQRARAWGDPEYPRGHMRLHHAKYRRPERPGSTRSRSARAALWLCPACERLQNYKHACRYCRTPRQP